ncbi:MAG TPA: MarR family winged helix-turn-helix transcriptional regulator [Pseudonocardiaceae bacterium]|jgi:DNA-binding MarR family transcriptional regulator|nr:MarR family winged helix-turn-helix transcriptional regulator [Pseudonocardiaceae bacterium]
MTGSADGDVPRWLDQDEQRTWLALIGVLIWLPAALDAQLQADAGLSHFEYQVLAMLSMSPNRTARMGDLAALANGSPSRLSHVVARAEKQGWVTRGADPDNKRVVLATLTDAGWDKVVATAPGHVEAVRRYVFDPLTPDQVRQLREALTLIRHTVDPEGRPPIDRS